MLSLLLVGCTAVPPSPESRIEHARHLATKASLTERVIHTPPFLLTTYAKINEPLQPLHVYIEGDGLAWLSYTQISPNPTPINPIALTLATQDKHPNVVYLARPCQYATNITCNHSDYWTHKRYAPEVIHALSNAINYYRHPKQPISLYGYSGGATLALYLAGQRTDIISIQTFAGNVDPEAITAYHHVTPLENTQALYTLLPRIAQIPQIHWVAENDTIIPPFITENFVQTLQKNSPNPTHIQMRILLNADHHSGWTEEAAHE